MELWLKRISNDHFYILSMLVAFKVPTSEFYWNFLLKAVYLLYLR